mmetsp:Transcript_96140/g.170621  ORF Transcript_96140/g.170621 Transcript_96140/m.170621 type:complete len:775 (-) Transcript_96140:237-2561(-)|eukprot:CAMPEP_0197638604 /NCGR_PEP_ID=MMETSP1338-20131121/13489_1 /TAXON_ID=43686 ORGANISM="Pelagodinium beii, Strain RCC1491" /NCGR_SAMPLE_ID=MMETSP1338 /ASSEMBLY_ACC=CAM_ASM_000754 /LENGTH=774 /DNA_ID=CAMNT_0043211211 /DNA_START=51 /DNA_END=2375 /DNA_ORIENTATION=-
MPSDADLIRQVFQNGGYGGSSRNIDSAALERILEKICPQLRGQCHHLLQDMGVGTGPVSLEKFVDDLVPASPQMPGQQKSKEPTAEPQKPGEEVGTYGDESSVCRTRKGCALRYQTILKADHFPSSQNHKLEEILEDVPNYRQVKGCKVFGVGQPGTSGYVRALQRILKVEGVEKILWINLREEPFVYINGQPYCVKERSKPFTNQELTGIDTEIIERIEREVVEEVLAEASGFNGKILLHGETKPKNSGANGEPAMGEAYCYWEEVRKESVLTVRSLTDKLVADGFPLVFHRVPVTDENAPELKDFDQILQCLLTADPSTAVVFNCQMGRGRTTTGMVLGVMLQEWIGQSRLPRPPKGGSERVFRAVAMLTTSLQGTASAKIAVDAALDRCHHMQHLLDAITKKIGTKHEKVGIHYLERYLLLIMFMTYIDSQTATQPFAQGFESWLFNHKSRDAFFYLIDHLTMEMVRLVTAEVLSLQDNITSQAVIEQFKEDEKFKLLSERLMREILKRDSDDGEKLANGIKIAVEKKVLPEDVEVEPCTKVSVSGRTADEVADDMIKVLGDASSKGCVLTLQGLSGTGKGTTVAKLKEKLPKTQTWSNGNVFRSLTLLAVTAAEQQGCELIEVLTPTALDSFVKMLEFGKFNGKFDVKIEGLGLKYFVSEVEKTVLKDSKVAKNIPTVAEVTQGEVVTFVQDALNKLANDGVNVILEGREQTLNHIRTPHRFELVLDDPVVIGMRQAALQMGAKAHDMVKSSNPDEFVIRSALEAAMASL